jgi:predicted glycosyltransferase
MRLIVYSHDAFGLGNIRRMLAICQYLLKSVPKISILLISGSPVLHSFRMPEGLDYIKLPCLGRDEEGNLCAKFLRKDPQEVTNLRSELIKTAIVNFEPDLILVDKKPFGMQDELKAAFEVVKTDLPETKIVLLLRDILDAPEVTIKDWHQNDYYNALAAYYDQILVVGMPEIFDVVNEYDFPPAIAGMTKFCGYICREYGFKRPEVIRQELQVKSDEKLVLVTPGGGGDGYNLVKTYLQGLSQMTSQLPIKTLIFSGPEMPLSQRKEFAETIEQLNLPVQISEFSDDIASYMDAADTVVCMGGYNTICEVLSLSKKAVVVPRVKPVQEQWIRAKGMSDFGLFKAIHPDDLTPDLLMDAVLEQVDSGSSHLPPVACLDLNALCRISDRLLDLVYSTATSTINPESSMGNCRIQFPVFAGAVPLCQS